jgi:hypothetical protein
MSLWSMCFGFRRSRISRNVASNSGAKTYQKYTYKLFFERLQAFFEVSVVIPIV